MDTFLLNAYSPTLLIPTLFAICAAYGVIKFNTRVSPTVPYAGEQSLTDRLQAPVEYGKDPVEFLRKTRKQLGDVFCVDLFAVKIVFALGPDGNKEVLRAAEDKLSFIDQLKWALGPIVDPMIDSKEWTPLSMKLARAYLTKQNSLEAYVGTHSAKLIEEHFDAWAAQDAVPLFESFSHLIISLLLVLLIGEDFHRAHGAELVPLMSEFERDLQHPLLRVVPGSLWRWTAPGKRLFATCARFDVLVAAELRAVLAHPEQLAGRGDYFAYIVQNTGDKFASFYGRHILTMVFGGHANAAMTIPWLFLHARRVPGALERIREEALLPSEERKAFLEACLRETGRLYTNTAVMRMTKKPVRVSGHLIPAGMLVAASPLATQRADIDADNDAGGIFRQSGRWDPMRFLEGSDAYASWFQRAEFVHFGLGAHACPGEKLARIIIIDLVLKKWMEKYEVEVISGLEEDAKGIDGVGAEGAWTEENFGTPSVRGVDPRISVRRREAVAL